MILISADGIVQRHSNKSYSEDCSVNQTMSVSLLLKRLLVFPFELISKRLETILNCFQESHAVSNPLLPLVAQCFRLLMVEHHDL